MRLRGPVFAAGGAIVTCGQKSHGFLCQVSRLMVGRWSHYSCLIPVAKLDYNGELLEDPEVIYAEIIMYFYFMVISGRLDTGLIF